MTEDVVKSKAALSGWAHAILRIGPVREESWVERVRVGGWTATRVDSDGHRDCYREQEAFGNCDEDDRK